MDGDLVGGDEFPIREIEEADGSECSSENGVGDGDPAENRENSFDRLSSLPEPLLIHILSYLETPKAASTCVLSKRWKSLWTDLPSLSFSDGIFGSNIEKTLKLVIRVHKAFSCRTVTYLDTLWIGLHYDPYFVNDVNSWVEFALKQKVKKLTLYLRCEGFLYVLPQPIYSCSSLIQLSVEGCFIEPHGSISWKHLTELVIGEVELQEDKIQKILLGCPVLHTLRLERCWGFERLHIDSKRLYELSVHECIDEAEGHLLEISVPYLRSLCVKKFPISEKELRIKNIPSLVRVLIEFCENEISDTVVDNVMELFRSLHHVKELVTDCMWVSILCDMAVMGLQFPESSRKSLILEAWRFNSFPGILALLESSPHLETLVLNCIDEYEESKWNFGPFAKEDLNCDLTCLKTVHLVDYADPNLGSEPMLTMARALLKRATVMEKMLKDYWLSTHLMTLPRLTKPLSVTQNPHKMQKSLSSHDRVNREQRSFSDQQVLTRFSDYLQDFRSRFLFTMMLRTWTHRASFVIQIFSNVDI